MIYSQNPVRYYVYILLCSDKSYYTGLTDDLGRRLMEHEEGNYPNCYTYKRRPIQLMYFETLVLLDDALKREEQIKKWSRAKKRALIQSNYDRLHRLAACDNFTHYMYREIRDNANRNDETRP